MGTSKHIAILLSIALGGLLAVGQDQAGASAPSSQPKASNTRFASCIVRITVDSAIMPLSLENIESLLQSSGVAVKAGREVLGLNEMEVFNLPLLKVEWLNASSVSKPSPVGPSRQMGTDEEMLRQMEQIYGADYARQMNAAPGQQKKEEAQTQASPPAAPPQDRPEVATQKLPGESDVAYRVRLNQMRVKAQQKTKARGTQGMGGMGGYGGGMGAYGGMGGTSAGGMMGGWRQGGMGFYGAPTAGQQNTSGEQSATVKLVIELPENVPPRADEFLEAVVTNLRESVRQAYESCRTDVEQMLVDAKTQYRNLQSELDGTADEMSRVQQQLDQIVDLSAWQPQMPLSEAIDVLRRTVEPPLNVMVLWKDLHENVSTEPTSPIGINGMPRVRLGTALDLLVKGLPLGVGRSLWRIKNEVIIIGTTAGILGRSPEAAGLPRVEADVVSLAGQKSELARGRQALELDLAGLDARQKAVQEQIAATREAVSKRLAEDAVTRELQRLLTTSEEGLAQAKKAAEAGRASVLDLSRAEASVVSVRIDLVRRQEELIRQVGGSQLEEFSKELSRIAIDKAEKEAQLQIVRKQLDEVQKQLAQMLVFDPEAAQLRLAQEALDITGRRVAELQARIASLQPPTVLVIGAN